MKLRISIKEDREMEKNKRKDFSFLKNIVSLMEGECEEEEEQVVVTGDMDPKLILYLLIRIFIQER